METPADSTDPISSPRRAKFAARMDGAISVRGVKSPPHDFNTGFEPNTAEISKFSVLRGRRRRCSRRDFDFYLTVHREARARSGGLLNYSSFGPLRRRNRGSSDVAHSNRGKLPPSFRGV